MTGSGARREEGRKVGVYWWVVLKGREVNGLIVRWTMWDRMGWDDIGCFCFRFCSAWAHWIGWDCMGSDWKNSWGMDLAHAHAEPFDPLIFPIPIPIPYRKNWKTKREKLGKKRDKVGIKRRERKEMKNREIEPKKRIENKKPTSKSKNTTEEEKNGFVFDKGLKSPCQDKFPS